MMNFTQDERNMMMLYSPGTRSGLCEACLLYTSYPRNALVTIGKITGKISFVALASYPLKRRRFIVMCLLPFVLGIIPYMTCQTLVHLVLYILPD